MPAEVPLRSVRLRHAHDGWNPLPPRGVGRAKRDAEEEPTDDAEAVTCARAGDLDAYEVLVARYTAVAHRTAYLLGAGDAAEDVVQETFVKAYRGLGRFRAGEPFRPWLLRIVVNETRNLRRSGSRRSALELRAALAHPSVDDSGEPEASTLNAEDRSTLLAAVRDLPEKDRLVVACRYFLDLSEAETAQTLGWPRGSVKSRLSRALDKLRADLSTVSTSSGTGVGHG